MELRELRYFLVVSEELHFGRAARRLHMTQPPLSVAVRRLERELGTALLERSTRRITLTEAGRMLVPEARRILHTVDDLPDLIDAGAQGSVGELTVGFVSSAGLSVLPPALRLFRERHERVELRLSELTTAEQLQALHDEEIDVGLVRTGTSPVGLTVTPVLEEGLVAAVPDGHPLSALDPLPPGRLAAEPLVLFPHRLMPDFHEAVFRVFEGLPNRPRVRQRAVHQDTILGLVAAGVGLSVLPASVTRIRRHGVVYRTLQDCHVRTPLSVVTRAAGQNSVRVRNFVECVRQAAAEEVIACQGIFPLP